MACEISREVRDISEQRQIGKHFKFDGFGVYPREDGKNYITIFYQYTGKRFAKRSYDGSRYIEDGVIEQLVVPFESKYKVTKAEMFFHDINMPSRGFAILKNGYKIGVARVADLIAGDIVGVKSFGAPIDELIGFLSEIEGLMKNFKD
jgi:hypothetical protein